MITVQTVSTVSTIPALSAKKYQANIAVAAAEKTTTDSETCWKAFEKISTGSRYTRETFDKYFALMTAKPANRQRGSEAKSFNRFRPVRFSLSLRPPAVALLKVL